MPLPQPHSDESIEIRRFQVLEICRWFNRPQKFKDLSRVAEGGPHAAPPTA
jgi:hypothetical protein